MNINATLIGQSIAFAIFVMFCMKFVWPPLVAAISDRQRKIADGLNAAEKAKADLATASQAAEQELIAAKAKAASLIDQANKSANQIIEDARVQAQVEGERIRQQAREAMIKKLIKPVKVYVRRLQNLPYSVPKKSYKKRSIQKLMPIC